MYTEIHLNKAGKQTEFFMGEVLAFVSNRETDNKTRKIWDSVKVCKIDPDWAEKQEKENGRPILPYTVGIARQSRWKGGRSRFNTIDCNTIEECVEVVRRRIPIFLMEVEDQIRLNSSPSEGSDYEPERRGLVT